MTGAEIVGACREAAQSALREALAANDKVVNVRVRQEHLQDALGRVKPPRVVAEYSRFEMNRS